MPPAVASSPAVMRAAEGQRRWAWPAADIGQASLRVEPILDRAVEDVVCDAMGWRIVIDAGDLPEPRLYLELDRPERWSRSGWWPAQPQHGAGLVGSAITAFTLNERTIELVASNGAKFRCVADPDDEMWQLVIAGQGVWVGLPGGGVAVFEGSWGMEAGR